MYQPNLGGYPDLNQRGARVTEFFEFFVGLAIFPKRLPSRVCKRDHDDAFIHHPIDDPKRKTTHQKKGVSFVAPGKALGIRGDRREREFALSVEGYRRSLATFGVPTKSFREIRFCGGTDEKVSHPAPLCGGLEP